MPFLMLVFAELQQAYDRCEQVVCQRVRFEAFEYVELVEHDLALAERVELQVCTGLDFAFLQGDGAGEHSGFGEFVQRDARHDGRRIVVKNVSFAKDRGECGTLGQVVQAEFVCTGAPVRFNVAIELVTLVQVVDIFLREVGEQERLAAVLHDVHELVEDFVGPGTQVSREDNLFGAGEGSEGVARFFAVVKEADLLHGALDIGFGDNDQVFVGSMDFLAVVLERNLQLVLAFVARCHGRVDAHLRKARLSCGFFRRND